MRRKELAVSSAVLAVSRTALGFSKVFGRVGGR